MRKIIWTGLLAVSLAAPAAVGEVRVLADHELDRVSAGYLAVGGVAGRSSASASGPRSRASTTTNTTSNLNLTGSNGVYALRGSSTIDSTARSSVAGGTANSSSYSIGGTAAID